MLASCALRTRQERLRAPVQHRGVAVRQRPRSRMQPSIVVAVVIRPVIHHRATLQRDVEAVVRTRKRSGSTGIQADACTRVRMSFSVGGGAGAQISGAACQGQVQRRGRLRVASGSADPGSGFTQIIAVVICGLAAVRSRPRTVARSIRSAAQGVAHRGPWCPRSPQMAVLQVIR